jgi:hypothetical protein
MEQMKKLDFLFIARLIATVKRDSKNESQTFDLLDAIQIWECGLVHAVPPCFDKQVSEVNELLKKQSEEIEEEKEKEKRKDPEYKKYLKLKKKFPIDEFLRLKEKFET